MCCEFFVLGNTSWVKGECFFSYYFFFFLVKFSLSQRTEKTCAHILCFSLINIFCENFRNCLFKFLVFQLEEEDNTVTYLENCFPVNSYFIKSVVTLIVVPLGNVALIS